MHSKPATPAPGATAPASEPPLPTAAPGPQLLRANTAQATLPAGSTSHLLTSLSTPATPANSDPQLASSIARPVPLNNLPSPAHESSIAIASGGTLETVDLLHAATMDFSRDIRLCDDVANSVLVVLVRLATADEPASLDHVKQVLRVKPLSACQHDLIHATLATFHWMDVDWACLAGNIPFLDAMAHLHTKGRFYARATRKWFRPLQYSESGLRLVVQRAQMDGLEWLYAKRKEGLICDINTIQPFMVASALNDDAHVTEEQGMDLIQWFVKSYWGIDLSQQEVDGGMVPFDGSLWLANAAKRGFCKILGVVARIWADGRAWIGITKKEEALQQIAQGGSVAVIEWIEGYAGIRYENAALLAIVRGAFEGGSVELLDWVSGRCQQYPHGEAHWTCGLPLSTLYEFLQVASDHGQVRLIAHVMEDLRKRRKLSLSAHHPPNGNSQHYGVNMDKVIMGQHLDVWQRWRTKGASWGVDIYSSDTAGLLLFFTRTGQWEWLQDWWAVQKRRSDPSSLLKDKKFATKLVNCAVGQSGKVDMARFWHAQAIANRHLISVSWQALAEATATGSVTMLSWWRKEVQRGNFTVRPEIVLAACASGQVAALEWWFETPGCWTSHIPSTNLLDAAIAASQYGVVDWIFNQLPRVSGVRAMLGKADLAASVHKAVCANNRSSKLCALDLVSLATKHTALTNPSVLSALLAKCVDDSKTIQLALLLDTAGPAVENTEVPALSVRANRARHPNVCILQCLIQRGHMVTISASTVASLALEGCFAFLDWCHSLGLDMKIKQAFELPEVVKQLKSNPKHPMKAWFAVKLREGARK